MNRIRNIYYGLIFIFTVPGILSVNAAETDVLPVESQAMGKKIHNLVILPDTYTNDLHNFPVVYILHGAGGDYTTMLNRIPELEEYADQYGFILICPDGGQFGWYLDSPVLPRSQYETYISSELISAVDATYRTDTTARAITGLSMGGHGALYLAIKHPALFMATGSMSGGVDITGFIDQWHIGEVTGIEYESNPALMQFNVVDLICTLEPDQHKIIIHCGTEDFFFEANQRLHIKMLGCSIPHEYRTGPGAHDYGYWRQAIREQLMFFSDSFD
ncbi:MAG: esterase family protein [Bacteroidales bacterium]|nr:esterase family protein [Bacteroidales bacterium]MCF8350056.1 esterase family protein [Bacteroidales bacterium]MCF8375000.1 esterase family protein [Bacteroidales bacterium]